MKSTHFLIVKSIVTIDEFARLHVKEIVWLYGAPVSIISDRDLKLLHAFGAVFRELYVHTLI